MKIKCTEPVFVRRQYCYVLSITMVIFFYIHIFNTSVVAAVKYYTFSLIRFLALPRADPYTSDLLTNNYGFVRVLS